MLFRSSEPIPLPGDRLDDLPPRRIVAELDKYIIGQDQAKRAVAIALWAQLFPERPAEMAAFGLNFCHGLGLGLHERPLISRLNSFIEPYELKAGMVFAVETFCPAKDGVSAARIEEEVVLTPTGAKIITLFPAQELPIANKY